MRSFTDARGRAWQAQVLDASYGAMQVLFSRLGSFEVFACALSAHARRAAEDELAAMDEEELRARLEGAQPWL